MRIILCGLLAIGICGCTKVKQDGDENTAQNENENAKSENDQSKRRSPGGVSGLVLPVEDDRPRGAGGGNQSNSQPAKTKRDNKTIAKVEARLVEWPKAKQDNPNLEVVENKVQGNDPISVAASAYVSASSKLEAANFKHNLDIMKANNGGRPVSFKQFQDLARQLRIKFQNQPPYRYYGYDTTTGGIVVLEDKAEKRRIYKEKDIPLEE